MTFLLGAMTSAVMGCSGDDVNVVTGAVTMPAEAPPSTLIPAGEPVSALSRLSLSVLAGTDAGSHLVAGTNLAPVEVVPLEGAAATTGAVIASTVVTDGQTEELLLVAEGGLYQSHGDRLVQSEASEALAGLTVHAIARDDAGTVWLAAADGLYELAGSSLRRFDLGHVTAVGASGSTVLAAVAGDDDDQLVTIEGEDVVEHGLDVGRVAEIRATSRGLALATTRGLVIHEADASWTRYTLSADEEGIAVQAIDDEPYAGLFAATEVGVVRLDGDSPVGVAPSQGEALAVDRYGDVWLGGGDAVTGLFVGVPVGFAEVAPILETACTAGCHAGGGGEIPVIDFTDYDTAATYGDRITARVTDGASPMPPSVATPLTADELDLLLRWVTTGTAP